MDNLSHHEFYFNWWVGATLVQSKPVVAALRRKNRGGKNKSTRILDIFLIIFPYDNWFPSPSVSHPYLLIRPPDLMAEMTAGPTTTKRSLPQLQVLTSSLQINPSRLDKRGQVKDYWLCATKHYISLETSLDIQQIDSIRLQFILFLWKREKSSRDEEIF